MDVAYKFTRRVVPATESFLMLPPDWWYTGVSVDMDFVNGRYYEGTVSTDPTVWLNCVRASTGYAQNTSGTWISFGSNVLRITNKGLLVEVGNTNFFLNSGSPVTQVVTLSTSPVGDYELWIEGSGSATITNGSGHIAFGNTTATEGSIGNFTIDVSGTFTVTITGTVTLCQLEYGNSGTVHGSYIATGGSTAARAGDHIELISTANTIVETTTFTILMEFNSGSVSRSDFGQSSSTGYMFLRGQGGAEIDNRLYASANPPTAVGWIGNSGIGPVNFGTGINTLADIVKMAFATNSSGRSIIGGGGSISSDSDVLTGSGTPSIGYSASFNSILNGYIRRFSIWNTRVSDATLITLTAA